MKKKRRNNTVHRNTYCVCMCVHGKYVFQVPRLARSVARQKEFMSGIAEFGVRTQVNEF